MTLNHPTEIDSILEFAEIRIREVESGLDQVVDYSCSAKASRNLLSRFQLAQELSRNQDKQAIPILESLVKEGFHPALAQIAGFYHNLGDFSAAYSYYCKAAFLGDIPSLVHIGYYLMNGGPGIARDRENAVKLFKVAAYAEYHAGCYYLGICYKDGIGTERNISKAYIALKAAADMGNSRACWELAHMIYNDASLDGQSEIADTYMRKAAETGLLAAQEFIARHKENG